MGADRPRSALALGEAWTALWTSRLLVWVAGVGAVWVWGLSDRAPGFDPAGVTGGPLFAPAARWDAVWYLVIARHGYVDDPSAAFFPLYPLLLRGLGGSVAAGILLSCACLLVALAVLRELTALELGDEAARWTVLMLAFSPMAFFLSAVYSESLFLALTAGAVLAVRRERWAWAGVRQLVAGAGGRIYFPQAAGDPMAIARINVVLALWLPLVGIALAGVLRRLPLAYGAYVVASLAVPLSYPVVPQPLMSLPRFVLVCFPLWMWLGWLLARHRRARAPALAASAILLAVSTAQFATWHFVA